MKEKNNSKNDAGAPAWMATFADMMSLLLTFFILLLSFAEMDIIKFKDAMGSIQEAFSVMPSGKGFMPQSAGTASLKMSIQSFEINTIMEARESRKINNAIMQDLKSSIRNIGYQENIDVENTEGGVVMRVRGKMFFKPGTAELTPDSHPVFQKIAELMREFPRKISIEGHTDNIPVRGGRYSNNWELSTARAYSVLKFLEEYEGIDVKNIHIAGYGDTHPIASNETPEGRAENRRVEFVFYE